MSKTRPEHPAGTRPIELIILSLVLAVFTGLIALMASRELLVSVVLFVVAFMVSLVLFAMLALASRHDERK